MWREVEEIYVEGGRGSSSGGKWKKFLRRKISFKIFLETFGHF